MLTVEQVRQSIADYLQMGVYDLGGQSELSDLSLSDGEIGPLLDHLEQNFGKSIKNRDLITTRTTVQDLIDIFAD